MNTSRSLQPVTRRRFLRSLALGLGASLLPRAADRATAAPWLFTGVNYPWIAYGVDFGQSGWGHNGVTTSGWINQTGFSSAGFTAANVVPGHAHSGQRALAITADLQGGDFNRSKGEVYVDLRSHAPLEVSAPVDLTGKTARCWLYLPPGSAGPASAPNGVVMFFKSLAPNGADWAWWYGPWVNISKSWEGTYHEFTAAPSGEPPYAGSGFDLTRVIAAGVKVGTNSGSTAALRGTFCLDDYQINTTPPLRFDFEQTVLEHDLAYLRCQTSVLRVFVFADGRAAPEFSGNGVANPAFDDYFFTDFDTLVATAARLNFKLIPVLLDYKWCYQGKIESGTLEGGHAGIIRDELLRQPFLDTVLTPLVQRYAGSPAILAWEIINEPEWVISELNPGNPQVDYVALQQMQDFVKVCADAIHAVNPALRVTVGSARRKWVSQWKGLGLDLYQFHWYDYMTDSETFPWLPYAGLGLDKPCFIGEVPTGGAAHTVAEYVKAAQDGGYSGLLVWSYRDRGEASNYASVTRPLEDTCTPLLIPGLMR